MPEQQRFIGLDIHRDYVVIAGVDGQQQVILEPCKVTLARFPEWSAKHLRSTDQVALKARNPKNPELDVNWAYGLRRPDLRADEVFWGYA